MNAPIVCVSPNTSTDRISIIRDFEPGGTFRTVRSFDQAGGSGTHAAYVINELGGYSHSIVLIGGANGLRWRSAAESARLSYDAVELAIGNRSSFVLVDQVQGKVAEIIDAGPEVTEAEADAFLTTVMESIVEASMIVLSGSIPPGMPDTLYRSVVEGARVANTPVVVDAHSSPLLHALEARPWLIKPNLDEFHQLLNIVETTLNERVEHLRELTGTVAENILLSMSEEGALLSTSDGTWQIPPPQEQVTLPGSEGINPVGSGDAMVGAVSCKWQQGASLLTAATWGLAASWVNLGTFGVPEIVVSDVERLVQLIEPRQIA